jgi:hypothetical protein
MGTPRVIRHEVIQPLDQSIKYIALTKGQTAIVDASDYDWLMQWCWTAYWHPRTKSFYARRNKGGPSMHRIIMKAKSGDLLDHRNGTTLDNRRRNLRFATSAQNAQNRKVRVDSKSGHTGIAWNPAKGKWTAQIGVKGRNRYLGSFHEISDAIAARAKAAQETFGEFSYSHRLEPSNI